MPNEPDFYRDTEHRYRTDADFHSAVDMLQHMAQRHGFTPGELKQIAFKAALNLEMLSARPVTISESAFGRHALSDYGPPIPGRRE